MQQKNRQYHRLRSQFGEFRQEIDPSGNPEHKSTEQEIDSEDVH
jgi:hypothetical protein